ncbi:DUF5666 domain-containing protein, partial [Nocardioides sp.]|uniref:DUF5666 domain-containing protein n=1 Tax=Nocardioides sp. TaxID=35761 RepID=UPI002ED7A474
MKLYARHKGANAVAVVTLAITLAACSGGGQSAAPDDPGSAATGQPSAAPDDPGSAATGQPTSTPNWAMTRPAALPADEDKVEITGTVADVNTNQRTFTVLGYRVQIDDDTTYEAVGRELDARRFFAAIRAGLSAQVKGRPDGQSIYAAEIELKYPEVIGKVASVGEGVITLGERTFRYDDDTRLEDGALPTAGDIAEVNYDPTSESDGHAYAAEIGGEDEPQIKSRTTDIDPESGQLKTWLGQTVLTGADTRYKVVGTEVSRSQFFDTVRRGDVIEAEGPLSGGTLQA